MGGNKIEISTWEACKVIDLMTELDFIMTSARKPSHQLAVALMNCQ
jgi:hypothetical protein